MTCIQSRLPCRCRNAARPSASRRPASATSREGSRPRPSSSSAPRARGSGTPRDASTSTSPAASAARTSGHNLPAVVDAVHAQVDRYMHQCFMVGMYEPYVDVCRRLAELSPCRGDEPEVDPAEQRRGGGRERRQDRARRHRPAGGDRLRQRLPRPDAPLDDDDLEGRPLQGGLRPLRARGLPDARAVSVPRRQRGRRDRRPQAALQGRRRPELGRLRRARAGAGRGRLHPDDARLPAAPAGAARPLRDPLRERRGAERAAAAPARSGRSSTTASSRTCSSPARRSAAACRSRPSPAAPR